MSNTRKFGISILSAAGLVGSARFLFQKNGLMKASELAASENFDLQLLPLATKGMNCVQFENYLKELVSSGIEVLSYEDRWGGRNPFHPWVKDLPQGKLSAVLAYYLLFPWFYREVQEKANLMAKYFPSAVAVDFCNSAQEISLNNHSAFDWLWWLEKDEARKQGVVIDTYHLLEFDAGDYYNNHPQANLLLWSVAEYKVPVRLLQIQFRKAKELDDFLTSRTSATEKILCEIQSRGLLESDTPYVLELHPKLVTVNKLHSLRKRIESIITT